MADLYQVRNGELVPIMSISQCMPISGGQFTGGVFETAVNLSASDIDVSAGTAFVKTLSEATSFTVSGVPASAVACFSRVLANGGDHVVTWPSSVRWTDGTPPELTPEGTDVLTFLTVNGGATWYGVPSLQGAA